MLLSQIMLQLNSTSSIMFLLREKKRDMISEPRSTDHWIGHAPADLSETASAQHQCLNCYFLWLFSSVHAAKVEFVSIKKGGGEKAFQTLRN